MKPLWRSVRFCCNRNRVLVRPLFPALRCRLMVSCSGTFHPWSCHQAVVFQRPFLQRSGTENAMVVAGFTARVKKKPTKVAKSGSIVPLGKLLSQYSQDTELWVREVWMSMKYY
ncbi:hypothetical protein V6N12_069101 [Hibiscus sabdariffa]|uniref:Uncharacterized protein n=1 Tax=Hibiscus sabdariffa TaxID=183260 RepID=A0ABR2FCU5_9ROSI